VIALQFEDGARRCGAIPKDGEDAITKRLHDTATVGLADTSDPLRQSRHRLGGARISHGLEDPGAPCQISEYDGRIDAHVVQFLVALAWGLWQSSMQTPFPWLKSLDLGANPVAFSFSHSSS